MDLGPLLIPLAVTTVLSFLASFVGIAALRRWGGSFLVPDLANERSSHTGTIPRGGGVVVVVVVLCGLGLYQSLVGPIVDWRTFVIFTSAAGFVALVSWLDDVHTLGNRVRLIAHALAAINAIAIFGYWRDVTVPVVGDLHFGFIGLPLTMLWVVGLANAFNFMDGSDGMAALQAIIAGLWAALIGMLLEVPVLMVGSLILASACLGFLLHNWAPARIFLGDVGSIFIGYCFAILVVPAGRHHASVVLAAGLVFAPIIIDTAITFLRRLLRGDPVFESHRDHLYQRMLRSGLSHSRVALAYAGYSLVSGVLALAWLQGGANARLGVTLGLGVLALTMWLSVRWIERVAGNGIDTDTLQHHPQSSESDRNTQREPVQQVGKVAD